MDLRFVTLAEIDLDDGTFEIKKFEGSTRLHESLTRFGILDPPWLKKKGGRHIVVDGFKRLRLVKENGQEGAVCRIFPQDYEVRELWTRRIEKKIFEREINAAEKAQIVSKLVELFQLRGIPRFFLSGLSVANRPEVLQKWALLSASGDEPLALLASGAIGERAAIEVADWDMKSRDSVLAVLRALRCSASIQVEIVERTREIAIREGKTEADIIEDPHTSQILDSEALNRRQKTQALREFLAEVRQPRLSSRLKRFRQQVEAIGLPPGVKIIPPAAFEGNNWTMELSFTGPGELRNVLESTRAIAGSSRLEDLF